MHSVYLLHGLFILEFILNVPMSAWWWLAVLLVHLVASCASLARQQLSLTNSVRFTRSVRTDVKKLLSRYKEQQLGDKHFEDRSLVLETLPSINTNYDSWLYIQDTERLNVASEGLQTFWTHLESHRKLLNEDTNRGRRSVEDQSLSQSFWNIQIDIRDLVKQVDVQLNRAKLEVGSSESAPCPSCEPSEGQTHRATTKPVQIAETLPSSLWARRLKGYIILRDLDRFLVRLARDLIFLKAKQQNKGV
uniref:Uncharacterized protein n=1 Tax=Denticeps clupeoides TaxID=299321 RepID=A0AAY4CP92_9TELE